MFQLQQKSLIFLILQSAVTYSFIIRLIIVELLTLYEQYILHRLDYPTKVLPQNPVCNYSSK
jgi:hypothetical protein